MSVHTIEQEPLGVEARTARIDTLSQDIMMSRLAIIHSGDPRSAHKPPITTARDEIMAGYTSGDIPPAQTIFHFQRLQPWFNDNDEGINEVDIAALLSLGTHEPVVVDNHIRKLTGNKPTLTIFNSPAQMPLKEKLGWAQFGSNLAVSFDTTDLATRKGPDTDHTVKQHLVSMHGLYNRLAVGQRDIIEHVYNRFPITLEPGKNYQQNNHSLFNNSTPFDAWNNATLLRSLHETGFASSVSMSSTRIGHLAQSVADNTNILLGMHKTDPAQELPCTDSRIKYTPTEVTHIADFINATRIGNPREYEILLNTLGALLVKNPHSRPLDMRTQLLAFAALPKNRAGIGLDDLTLGDVTPVFLDLQARGNKQAS
ncbi:MAG: hypothetical protein WBP26_03160 [Candidatus Saccharimonadales bacterium]